MYAILQCDIATV